jgi:hypothetical protein
MKIALLEIAPHGHYTYVESIAQIFSADAENEVVIFTNERGNDALKHIENQQISIKIWRSQVPEEATNERLQAFLSDIKGFDKLFVVTLEANFKAPFRIMQIFEKIDFNCPIFYVIHNSDFWFELSFDNKMRQTFYQLDSFKTFIYRLKVYFYYSTINAKIVEKVKQSNGYFVTLTTTVGAQLAQYVGAERVIAVPFSVYDGRLGDKSMNNKRLRVCMPGFVSSVRRDYASIFKILAADTEGVIRDGIEFDFLGGISIAEGGETIRDEAKRWIDKGYHLHIYDKSSVGLVEFDENLAQSDIVLGNLNLVQGIKSSYGKSKESGLIFTMIKAAKAGLLPADYALEPALTSSVLRFNNYDEVAKILIELLKDKQKLQHLKATALDNAKKFTPLSILKSLSDAVVFKPKT